jgi:hypothetical protein
MSRGVAREALPPTEAPEVIRRMLAPRHGARGVTRGAVATATKRHGLSAATAPGVAQQALPPTAVPEVIRRMSALAMEHAA